MFTRTRKIPMPGIENLINMMYGSYWRRFYTYDCSLTRESYISTERSGEITYDQHKGKFAIEEDVEFTLD